MGYRQTTTINDAVTDIAGWCLRFCQNVFTTKPYGYNSAWLAWVATQAKHYDRNFPSDVVVPVWFSHMGNYDGTGIKNWGHVVAHFPGRGFLSSPGNGGPSSQWFATIEAIESYFRCTHVGWSEDINDLQVITGGASPDPTPSPAGRSRIIVAGDTLWDIASLYYGDGSRYMDIFNASNFSSGNPSLIYPGELAIIP